MNPGAVNQAELIIVAADAVGFSRIVRASDCAQRFGINIIPLQYRDEAIDALEQNRRVLLVIDLNLKLTAEQEDLLHLALQLGANWCSVSFFEGIRRGFARVQMFHEILEWINFNESSSLVLVRDKIICMFRRLVALCGLISLSPLLAVIAIIIKCVSDGPVFYRQRRMGHKGRSFELVKFRTMHRDSEKAGAQWSTGNYDPRIFSFGRFLRRTHLDELPQLWNVLKGELCFVGPRPERPEFYELLKQHTPHFTLRTRITPGITGLAQLRSGYAATVEESQRKLEFDLYFMRTAKTSSALGIISGTAKKCGKEILSAFFAVLRRGNNRVN
ncbi:MAG: hypothetical protein RLZZ488_2081 [Pseudomonadota bacterium]|jgi:lipopolysaccharide/colanic/teichoic acid biosynthesis glycosyltransferase